jgi:hypothetical protein
MNMKRKSVVAQAVEIELRDRPLHDVDEVDAAVVVNGDLAADLRESQESGWPQATRLLVRASELRRPTRPRPAETGRRRPERVTPDAAGRVLVAFVAAPRGARSWPRYGAGVGC